MQIRKFIKTKRQDGIASLLIVSILVALIALLSIGFSRLVNRDLSQSVTDQKAQAAYYAAESGVNYVIKQLNINQTQTINNSSSSNCTNTLQSNLNNSVTSNISYGCVLLNANPKQLNKSPVNPMSSWVVKISPTGNLSSLFVSWLEYGGSATPKYFASGQSLLDENTWNTVDGNNQSYPPLLRVTLYSVPASGVNANSLSVANGFSSKTFFLYPVTSGGSTSISYAATDGSIQSINCNTNPGGYNLPAAGYCGASLTNLPSAGGTAYYYYARITPLYAAAKVYIQGQDTSGNSVAFDNTQAVIDVTAKTNDVVKRLQATVDLTNPNATVTQINAIPEFALSSSAVLCKRFAVSSTGTVTMSTSAAGDCTIAPPKQPGTLPVATTQAATQLNPYTGFTLNGKVQPNYPSATYYFQYSLNTHSCSPPSCYSKTPLIPLNLKITGATTDQYAVSATLASSALQYSTVYKFRTVAVNYYGTSYGPWVTFTTPAPPPSSSTSTSSTSTSSTSTSSTSTSTTSSGSPPPITCNSVTVTLTGTQPSYASYSASSSGCDNASSTSWTWDVNYPNCGGDNGGSSGDSATVARIFNAPGTITFTIHGFDSSGVEQSNASGSSSVSPGNFGC